MSGANKTCGNCGNVERKFSKDAKTILSHKCIPSGRKINPLYNAESCKYWKVQTLETAR